MDEQATLAPRSLAQLLSCPPAVEAILNRNAETIPFEEGEILFRQGDTCLGLYVVMAGTLARRTVRHDARLPLGDSGPGDLVELAAVLGEGRHGCTLRGISKGLVMRLRLASLLGAFEAYPALRMRLLGELAREVSRGYDAGLLTRQTGLHKRLPMPQKTDG